jgi:hypothetical protein
LSGKIPRVTIFIRRAFVRRAVAKAAKDLQGRPVPLGGRGCRPGQRPALRLRIIASSDRTHARRRCRSAGLTPISRIEKNTLACEMSASAAGRTHLQRQRRNEIGVRSCSEAKTGF